MNTDIVKLQTRLRVIQWAGLAFIGLTVIARFVTPWHEVLNGLLIGEVGGAGAVWSMVRQGHLRDNQQGPALMVSGIIGFFTRMILLIAVMVLAIKLPHVNVIAALVGYLLGFVFIVVGLSRSA
ncbi:ATP synthase subunit I [Alicyclobacillus pomorum]|uniref:ATP synthase subunit I n=1 Tax=Alicyclobacillus pomorum TaxID=204470 RepID=UPI000413B73D|nr:ATP synthase subunit I [Alicyclobacillus pomorum]